MPRLQKEKEDNTFKIIKKKERREIEKQKEKG